ncbi:MAG: hypothetical protein KDB06_07660 [Ilumatobacter sp.]|nr:hypothetical protein [Ilumatobacter sp.]MCB0984513.1 hypothetical protein [Ilumatobacter sp.]
MDSNDFERLAAGWYRDAAGLEAPEDAVHADPVGCILFLSTIADAAWDEPLIDIVAQRARPVLLRLAAQDERLLALVADWLGVLTAVEAIGPTEFGRRYILQWATGCRRMCMRRQSRGWWKWPTTMTWIPSVTVRWTIWLGWTLPWRRPSLSAIVTRSDGGACWS